MQVIYRGWSILGRSLELVAYRRGLNLRFQSLIIESSRSIEDFSGCLETDWTPLSLNRLHVGDLEEEFASWTDFYWQFQFRRLKNVIGNMFC